jgi:hypothetical protein
MKKRLKRKEEKRGIPKPPAFDLASRSTDATQSALAASDVTEGVVESARRTAAVDAALAQVDA